MPRLRRPSRRTVRVTAATVAAVVLVLVAALAVDALVVVHRLPAVAVRTPGSDDGTTYLLLASDSRDRLDPDSRRRYADRAQPAGERADLVLVLRRDAGGVSTLYSLPRDLYVGRGRGTPHRLGLALEDGPQAMVDSLCRDVGVGVDHVLVVDMDAVVALVDATGPVVVRTDAPMRDAHARLDLPTAGEHRLDGHGALAWVRTRSAEELRGGRWVPASDRDPTRTTHAAQVLEQVRAAVRDPIGVQRAAWAVAPHLRRDDDLGVVDLAELGRSLSTAVERGVVPVPARAGHSAAVPVAFVTEATQRALEPVRTRSCSSGATG